VLSHSGPQVVIPPKVFDSMLFPEFVIHVSWEISTVYTTAAAIFPYVSVELFSNN